MRQCHNLVYNESLPTFSGFFQDKHLRYKRLLETTYWKVDPFLASFASTDVALVRSPTRDEHEACRRLNFSGVTHCGEGKRMHMLHLTGCSLNNINQRIWGTNILGGLHDKRWRTRCCGTPWRKRCRFSGQAIGSDSSAARRCSLCISLHGWLGLNTQGHLCLF